MSQPRPHGSLNSVAGPHGLFVLPDTDDDPTGRDQPTVGVPVPFYVGRELVGPPLAIRLGSGGVDWTAVPEAAVDVDGHTGAAEYDVRSPAKPRDGRDVHPVAQSSPPKLAAEREFRLGIPSPLGLHARSRRGG